MRQASRRWMRARVALGLTVGLTASGCVQPRPAVDLDRRVVGELTAPAAAPERDPAVERTSAVGAADSAGPAGPLTLEAAVAIALRSSPVLGQSEASVEAARGNLTTANAGFYPTIQGSYSYQAFSSQVGFTGTRDRFPVLPVRGFGPGTQDFHVTEMQLRYTIFQFGKQWSRHDQATWRAEVARLERGRAVQTVTYDVATAYFQILQARASVETAGRAVERAEAFAEESAAMLRRGVITREEDLRAQAALASVRQSRVDAESEEKVAVAGLNRAMGIAGNAPTRVADRREAPEFRLTLDDSLRLAVANRRELPVVRRGIAIAQGDADIARADFLPSVSIQAAYSNVTGTGIQNANVGAGGIFVTQDLFGGGRRRGQLHAAEAGVRQAIAQAQQVCDGIAYEVIAAHHGVEDARVRIGSARAVAEQARENARLVESRARAGDATPAETIEAQAGATRAEQTFHAANYLYQQALARLAYAVGTPIPVGPGDVPEAARPETAPETAPPPSGTRSPFERRSSGGALPGLSAPPDLGGDAPSRSLPSPGATPPAAPDGSRLMGPPTLSRPPYESTSPLNSNRP